MPACYWLKYENQIERFLTEWDNFIPLVAFDFHDTIFDTNSKGYDFSEIIATLKQAQKAGCNLKFYLPADESEHTMAIGYLKGVGLTPDFVSVGDPSGYSLFISNRAGLYTSIRILRDAIRLKKTRRKPL